jgi:hypothetical protein
MSAAALAPETRQAVLRIGLFAITQHMLDHELPVPHDIYLETRGGRDTLRVLVSGAGQQMRWLNTVHIDDETQEPVGLGRLRMSWTVRLDCGITFELVGHRAGDERPVLAEVVTA